MANTPNVTLTEGFITIKNPSGPPTQFPVADLLRAADIPEGLTSEHVDGVRLLSNMVVILIRTLISRQVLDDAFADSLGMDWDLDHIIYALEQLGGSYDEPNFDNVEDA